MKLMGWGTAFLWVLSCFTHVFFNHAQSAETPPMILKHWGVCEEFLKNPKKLEDFSFVKISSFNVRNLFITPRSAEIEEEEEMNNKRTLKPLKEIYGVANAIFRQLPHIIVLQEIDKDGDSLKVFAEKYLNGLYEFKMAPSPDERGIANAFLIRKDFPVDLAIVSHGEEKWQDPTQKDAQPEYLFRRDFPLLALYPKGEVNLEKAPLLGIFGVHFKSKRDRDNDSESHLLRQAEATRAAEIFNRYLAKWGSNTCLMITGDFNGVAAHEEAFSEFRKLSAVNARAALLAGAESSLPRGTHLYWPRGGSLELKELDHFFINAGASKYLIGTVTDRYKTSRAKLNYKYLRENIRKYPSDHFFINITLSLQDILANYRKP